MLNNFMPYLDYYMNNFVAAEDRFDNFYYMRNFVVAVDILDCSKAVVVGCTLIFINILFLLTFYIYMCYFLWKFGVRFLYIAYYVITELNY